MREFNTVVFGAGGVGKSALTVRFVKDVFVTNYDPTIEEAYQRVMEVDGSLYSLEILDTAGAEQFRALNDMYIKNGRGFVLVFSLTQESSLREIEHLRQQIFRVKGGERNIPMVVIGTKLDLAAEREVSKETMMGYAVRWGVPFYETSAKRDWNVRAGFEDLVRQMRDLYPVDPVRKKRSKLFFDKEKCVLM